MMTPPPPGGSAGGAPDYAFQGYRDAWAGMRHALATNQEVFVLTAPAGSGKTTLLANFLGDFASEETFVATADATDLEGGSLFNHLLSLLGIPTWTPNSFADLEQVGERLGDFSHALLAVDDAHALTDAAFKDLLKLSYLRGARGPLLQVVLVGEEPVLARLAASELVQMNLWHVREHRLAPLSRPETGEFIAAWFRRQEGDRDPSFNAESLDLAYRWSGGLPGRLVLLCNWLAQHVGAGGRDVFGLEDVRMGIRGQEGLEDIDARASLAARFDGRAASLPPGEADEGRHATADAVTGEAPPDLQPQNNASFAGPEVSAQSDSPPSSSVGPLSFRGGMSSSLETAAWDRGSSARGKEGQHLSGVPSLPIEERQAPASVDTRVAPTAASAPEMSAPSQAEERSSPGWARTGRVGVAALFAVGLFAAFQLGGYLAAPGMAPSSDVKPAGPADDGSAVPALVFPVPSPALPLEWASGQVEPAPPPEPTIPPGPVQAIAQAIESDARSSAEAEAAGRIENLLRLASEALENDYLRTPRDKSAWHYYRQVLEADPGNATATLGMKLIVARYAELTRMVLARGDLDRAQVFIDRGQSLAPGDPALARLQEDVMAARMRLAEEQRRQALQKMEEQQSATPEEAPNPLKWLQGLLRGNQEPREQ